MQPERPPAQGTVRGPWLVAAIVIVIGVAVTICAYILFRK